MKIALNTKYINQSNILILSYIFLYLNYTPVYSCKTSISSRHSTVGKQNIQSPLLRGTLCFKLCNKYINAKHRPYLILNCIITYNTVVVHVDEFLVYNIVNASRDKKDQTQVLPTNEAFSLELHNNYNEDTFGTEHAH